MPGRVVSVQLRAEALGPFFRSFLRHALGSFKDCDDTFADLGISLNNLHQAEDSLASDVLAFDFRGKRSEVALLLL